MACTTRTGLNPSLPGPQGPYLPIVQATVFATHPACPEVFALPSFLILIVILI